MAQPNLRDAVESAFEAFSIAFRAGRRVFGKARFPRVVIVDAGTHKCGQHCNIIAVSFGIGHTSTGDKSVLFDGDDTTGHTRISRYERKLFVCPDTLMSHKCGVDVCTGEYMVTAEGRVCCLTGSIVGGDASVLSHGWREDVGRTGWEGANAMVGTGEYGTMAKRHNEGGDTRPGRRICKQKKANSRWNVSTLELDHCARLVRKMFHGSHERRIYWEESLCTATSKAIVAIDRYVRLARSNNEVIHIGRVGRLFRRYCGKFSNAGSVFPDDVHANTLAMGYCKCAADFLAELLPSRQSVSLPPHLLIVALLYLQRRGVGSGSRTVVERDALLVMLLPEANLIDKFGMVKGSFTTAKNLIQAALSPGHLQMTYKPRTITQILRTGAAAERDVLGNINK
jgi:hypothetical protein